MPGARGRYFALVLLASGLLVPATVMGQWIEEPGHGWISATVFHHDTTSRFDEEGNVESLFNEGGRSIATSLFLTGVYGLRRGIDLWAEVPFHRLEFNDVVEDRLSTGIGDPKFHLRIGPEVVTGGPLPVPLAVRAGVKLSVGDFPVDTEIIPLTEGQRDWEVLLEIGHSFWPRSEYAMGWIGYRWRERNEKISRDFGDELFFFAATGGSLGRWTWKASAEGIFGQSPEVFGLKVPADRRRLVQLMPSLGRDAGPGVFEIGGRFPLLGRNLPAGPAVFVGYFVRFKSSGFMPDTIL